MTHSLDSTEFPNKNESESFVRLAPSFTFVSQNSFSPSEFIVCVSCVYKILKHYCKTHTSFRVRFKGLQQDSNSFRLESSSRFFESSRVELLFFESSRVELTSSSRFFESSRVESDIFRVESVFYNTKFFRLWMFCGVEFNNHKFSQERSLHLFYGVK